MPPVDDPLIGTEVSRFRIERLIGKGGMGRVYLGVQPAIGARVAIKVLHATGSAKRTGARFAREGERWLPVIEHLSYAEMPGGAGAERGAAAAPLEPAMSQRELALALDAAAAPLWAQKRPIEATISIDTIAIGPELWNELHGEQVRTTPLLAGPVEILERRAAAIGTRGALPTVAYWIGTLRTGPAAPTLRASLVFERSDRWRIGGGGASSRA